MNLFLDRVLDAAPTTQNFGIQASLKLKAICLLQLLTGWITNIHLQTHFFSSLRFWFLCVALGVRGLAV